MDTVTLLATIQSAYADLEKTVAPLQDEQWLTANEGEWSVKDVMAHVAAWELICAGWLEIASRGETPRPAERLDLEANERIYQQYRQHSLEEIKKRVGQAHQQLLTQITALVQTVGEEALNARERYSWTWAWPGYSLIAVIADNSYEHYADHAQQIRQLLAHGNQ
jgi:hypothetical protein